MKKIYLIRHAKSDWVINGIADIDRPLNERGYIDANLIGDNLAGRISGAVRFISSPAIRAISTALIIGRKVNYDIEKIHINKKLYEAEDPVYFDLLMSVDSKVSTVVIFAHNPAISSVVAKLSGTREADLPTCAVSILNTSIEKWENVVPGGCALEQQIFPEKLK